MKYLLTLLFLASIGSIQAQKKEIIAQIIMQNNDTINSKIIVDVNFFDQTMVNELSIIHKIKILDSNGKKIKLEAKEVKELKFTDLKNKKRTFKFDGKKQLREVIYEGKTKAYYEYSANLYDGSKIIHIEFYYENGERVKAGAFSSSKATLKKIVQDNETLLKFIDETKLTHEETIIYVLTQIDAFKK